MASQDVANMNIQDACNCKICFSDFDDNHRRARVLACGHTFCAACITDMIKSKSGSVTCPNCRSEHTLTTASDLNVNYIIEEMFSAGRTASAIASVPGPVPDYNVGKSLGPKLSAGVCDDHGQYLLFNCSTCKVWICQACTVLEHPREKCTVLSIKKAIEDIKTNATSNINCQIGKCDAALAKLNSYDRELEEQVQSHQNYLVNQEAAMDHCRDIMEALKTERRRACKERDECYGAKQDLEALVGRIDDTFTLQEVNDCLQDAHQFEETTKNWTKHFKDSFPNETLVSKSKKMQVMHSVALRLINWDTITHLKEEHLSQIFQATKRMLLQALLKATEVYAVVEKDHQIFVPLIQQRNSFTFGAVQDDLPPPQARLISLQELITETGPVYAVIEVGERCLLAARVSYAAGGYSLDPLPDAQAPARVSYAAGGYSLDPLPDAQAAARVSYAAGGYSLDSLPDAQVPTDSCKIPLLDTLVKAGLVYGVSEEGGRGGVARLSCINTHAGNQFCLHVLRNQPPPPADSFKISYRHLHKMVGKSTVEVFLDLAWGGNTRGRVYIQVDVASRRGQQFLMLCTGEKGFSYVNTKLLSVANKGHPGEFILGGDYENNDGSGGAALLTGLTAVRGAPRPLTAGLLSGHNHSDKSSQFLIYTKDLAGCEDYLSFGKVREGLDVLVSAAALSDPHEAIVEDCGVVISL